MTTIIDTVENVQTLIAKVEKLIDTCAYTCRQYWYAFLQECKFFVVSQGAKVEDHEGIEASAKFVCQANNWADYWNLRENNRTCPLERVKITRTVTLTKKAFDYVQDNLMNTQFFLDGQEFGGTDCDNLDTEFPQYDIENMEYMAFNTLWQKDLKLQNYWKDNCYEICLLIKNNETHEQFLASPQGYNYMKYTSFDFTIKN